MSPDEVEPPTPPTLYEAARAFYNVSRSDVNYSAIRKALGEALKANKPKKQKRQSRADRWSEAAATARSGLDDLRSLQEEYEEWQGNLPDSLSNSPVGEKLSAICDLDIEGAISTLDDVEGADLPLGFGND